MADENDSSIRDSLSAAFDAAETTAPAPTASEPVKAVQTASEPVKAASEPVVKAPTSPAKPSEPSEATPAPAEPAAPAYAAPASWKPATREHWAKVPREVQEEIHRRETDTARVLTESADSRRFAQAFQETIRPFEAIIAAEAPNPLAAVRGLMQTVAGLRTGSPAQRARIVADIVKNYGVDVNELDESLAAVMSGQAPPQQQQQYNDPRLDQLTQFMQSVQGTVAQRQQQANQQAAAELERFGASHEFFGDVREDMADVMDFAAKRGRTITLEQAYEQAVHLNPEIRTLAEQRRAVAQAQAPNPVLEAKKAASSSIQSASAGGNGRAEPTSIRGAIEAAFDAHR